MLDQNYGNFEHIIVDGASTDDTVQILKRYPHLNWISEPDNGEAEALNKGLRMASGDIIGWLNADDWYAANVFQAIASTFNSAPDVHLVYGRSIYADENGSPNGWLTSRAPINLTTLSCTAG